ncbi:MAG: hypothetical protein O3C43_06585 [Verrucomicrobia bacterium]|nr:hypothetical protein [Verrucomicrobiota bacterium]MDA1066154.1 hypothetical protein [Verrucomicrobiota bacterium]
MMKYVLKIQARLGLVLTIVPPVLYLLGSMELSEVKMTMLIGTIMWLVIAPVIQSQNEQR